MSAAWIETAARHPAVSHVSICFIVFPKDELGRSEMQYIACGRNELNNPKISLMVRKPNSSPAEWKTPEATPGQKSNYPRWLAPAEPARPQSRRRSLPPSFFASHPFLLAQYHKSVDFP